MRYKKKKRQIVSAALAAMMAMQLCIPSATFAAVPTKKLKVITGFTELPEEVAHIQIPADAGENFEDYLNFPETIEASVVEYKNVNHQKIMRIAIRERKMRKRQQTTVIRKKTLELLPAVMQRKKI